MPGSIIDVTILPATAWDGKRVFRVTIQKKKVEMQLLKMTGMGHPARIVTESILDRYRSASVFFVW